MTPDTDIRLRSWLDTNQRDREQMCRALLALDSHYSEVRPRHPSGGPDGGRDMEALFDGTRRAFGAVGFANGANDSAQQKKQIRRKFTADLASARAADPEARVFVFFTNVHLAIGEQDAMKQEAKNAGIEHCDILDRERLRIELDAPGGFFIRYQHLAIPLSEAEQASFLSKYGTQIQEVVTTGFQKVEKTLNRLLFLAESQDVLDTLTFRFVLKKSYPASEIGHFRAFVFLALRERRPDMFMLWFGSSDRADRFRNDLGDEQRDNAPGIENGISSGQWESYLPPRADYEAAHAMTQDDGHDEGDASEESDDDFKLYRQTSWTSGAGRDPVSVVFAAYRHADSDRGDHPRFSLRDFDEGMYLPFVNAALAEKIHSIQIFANGYKLNDLGPQDFTIDRTDCGRGMPAAFTTEELGDPWVRLRPAKFSSAYHLRFGETTPRRMYGHEEPSDSAPPP